MRIVQPVLSVPNALPVRPVRKANSAPVKTVPIVRPVQWVSRKIVVHAATQPVAHLALKAATQSSAASALANLHRVPTVMIRQRP